MAILEFLVSGLILVWLWILILNSRAQYLCIWVRAYWFSVTSFSKWLPGGHIRFFGFWTAWFQQRNSSLLWNFSVKFHVHVLCGCRQKPDDCQLCRFQNGCLVILNNVQLQSTHCHPLLLGGGILVDHWSIISSLYLVASYQSWPFWMSSPVNTAFISTGLKQCTFHWSISSVTEVLQKQRVFKSLIIHHMIMITCISYGNIFAMLVQTCINIAPL